MARSSSRPRGGAIVDLLSVAPNPDPADATVYMAAATLMMDAPLERLVRHVV
jgi:hypothetical protein